MTEYHDIPRMSQSKLKLCWEDPALFHEVYIAKTRQLKPPTPQMQFGLDTESFLFNGPDSLVFEGTRGAPQITVLPESVLRVDKNGKKSRAGKPYEDWLASQPEGALIMREHERKEHIENYRAFLEPFECIKKNIEACPKAKHLVYGGRRKVVILWSYMNVEMKSEIDLLHDEAIGDVKVYSDNDCESFSSSIANHGLDIQAATYQLAVEQETGKLLPFIFVVARNKPSYSVELIECSEKYLRLGRERLQERIQFYQQCLERNEWRSPTWNRIVEVDPPRWFESQMEAWSL